MLKTRQLSESSRDHVWNKKKEKKVNQKVVKTLKKLQGYVAKSRLDEKSLWRVVQIVGGGTWRETSKRASGWFRPTLNISFPPEPQTEVWAKQSSKREDQEGLGIIGEKA